MSRIRSHRSGRLLPAALLSVLLGLLLSLFPATVSAQAKTPKNAGKQPPAKTAAPEMGLRQILNDAGAIGYVIIALSVAMVALIIEHLLTIRRGALMPAGLAEQVHQLILQGQIRPALQLCEQQSSFLGHVLSAGLQETALGYHAVEKAMEDAGTEQSARLFRKIEYLSVIGTLAPMIGLLGTVWGLMLAFQEFELKTNPHIAELAPGIRKAMVTTLMGLMVAVPALASFAFFRNRIDELVAESSLMAEHVFADYKRAVLTRRKTAGSKERAESSPPARAAGSSPAPTPSPPAEKSR